ncbi:GNAT family N-acetyltransferase [Sphingomonas sp. PB2P19]|uniref:GNAT family N-acetyltransferase n=1 Tax=Sphingomonas rhamnosi TaxID=3096156 RepID=UPI002FC5B69B
MTGFTHRPATEADIPAITALMARAIDRLQDAFLTPAQVAASRAVMGLDTQLIADRTYRLVHDADGALVGCGGWSRRATLYGGDHSISLRDAALLDPATEAARIRAMYTDPNRARQGIGRLILTICESAARDAGFARAEMMATLAGEPLYRACGYSPIERIETPGDVPVPMVRMGKSLTRSGDV